MEFRVSLGKTLNLNHLETSQLISPWSFIFKFLCLQFIHNNEDLNMFSWGESLIINKLTISLIINFITV